MGCRLRPGGSWKGRSRTRAAARRYDGGEAGSPLGPMVVFQQNRGRWLYLYFVSWLGRGGEEASIRRERGW